MGHELSCTNIQQHYHCVNPLDLQDTFVVDTENNRLGMTTFQLQLSQHRPSFTGSALLPCSHATSPVVG